MTYLIKSSLQIFLIFVIGFCQVWAISASEADETELTPLNRFPTMVQEFFVKQVNEIDAEGENRRSKLKTRSDAEAYVASVREKIQQSFGPWPDKTPLNPRITGVVERDQYRIENVIFESRPGFLVTANFYVPKGRKFPLPGVLGTCGHSSNGKAAVAYQSFAQGLALQGYVVLLYDPISQGERLQYPDQELKSEIGVGVGEHLYGGNQQYLVGDFIGSWRAWDGIRGVDYLLSRKEVDPKQIGVTGNSGGGTMTTWLSGIEQRFTMSAPSCFVTSFRRNLENELPADTEQCPPRVLALGLDHSDWLVAMGPRPVIILAKEKDYFDARGAEIAFKRVRNLYRLLGVEDRAGIFIGPSGHGYSQENREAMYRWFNQVTQISTLQSEPDLRIEEDELLWCTPKGQVSEMRSRTVFDYTADKSSDLRKSRPRNLSEKQVRSAVREVLKLKEKKESNPPDYRILRQWEPRAYPMKNWTTYLVKTEPGIHAVVYRLGEERLMSRPHAESKRAILYVSHLSSDAELRKESLLLKLANSDPNSILYTVDVRGIGESMPNTCGQDSFSKSYGNDYFYAAHSIMLDRPYLGQRASDVLRVLDWLKDIGHKEVHLVGNGWGALPALFAAVLCDQVTQVTLRNALTSYSEIAESKYYNWPLALLPPGILEKFDLPDCYRILQSKDLRTIAPVGAEGIPINE